MTPTEVEALAKQIEDLSPPDKLCFAAGLLENRKAELAYVIARKVIDELGAALALVHAPAEPAKPNPFDGWTIKPWKEGYLWATKKGEKDDIVGMLADGWTVWLPGDSDDSLDKGSEDGVEGGQLAENALIKAGATIPWRKDNR